MLKSNLDGVLRISLAPILFVKYHSFWKLHCTNITTTHIPRCYKQRIQKRIIRDLGQLESRNPTQLCETIESFCNAFFLPFFLRFGLRKRILRVGSPNGRKNGRPNPKKGPSEAQSFHLGFRLVFRNLDLIDYCKVNPFSLVSHRLQFLGAFFSLPALLHA